ncbi:MAG: acetamidase/formamidase family protein [Candidatus Moduliflexus flocculans]|nr:acetamidase/formamidase family protein [Candidatus Moduliflexus flocculans]
MCPFALPAAAEVVRFKPAKGVQTYAVREPVLTLKPGDTLETNTLWSDWFVGKDAPWPGEVGPIAIEGAEPGDTLVVRILKIRPNAPLGRSGTSIVYGSVTATTSTPMLNEPVPDKMFLWKIAGDGRSAVLDLPNSRLKQARVDLVPMLGRLATAPPDDQAVPGGVPSTFGGNMDTSEAREGTTVYLPVYHEGAGFYFGDVHALQGDGEVIGSGIETSADVAFEFGLLEKEDRLAAARERGLHHGRRARPVPLIDAFRIAHVEMVKWLESEYGFDRWEALQVLSQVGTAQVANVVDPNYTVVARFPKRYLPGKV